MSRWNTFLDFTIMARARWAQNKGELEKALELVERDARADSRYARVIPLYRLTLMIALSDPRRSEVARSIATPQWALMREDDCKRREAGRRAYLDAYRRFVCGVALGNTDQANEAAMALRQIEVDPFTRHTLRSPIPRPDDFYFYV